MAHVTRKTHTAGVYQHVIAAHEREIEICAENRVPCSSAVVERLERLHRGETPIEFPAEYLPDDVRPPSTSGAFGDIAMLAADGALSFRAETSRDWLRENDLL